MGGDREQPSISAWIDSKVQNKNASDDLTLLVIVHCNKRLEFMIKI